MAVVQTNSAQITARNSGVLANAAVVGGSVESAVDIVPLANGDSIASVLRIVRLPSNARIVDVRLFNTAITAGAADVGLYQVASNGGAVVDADFFSAAQSIATASAGTSVGFGNILAPANRNKRLWEALGLAVDPGRDYDVALTLTAATTAAGTAGLDVTYVI